MDLFYCLNQVSLKLPSTQVLPLGNLHARATPVPQAVLGGGCILQNSCGHREGEDGDKNKRTSGQQTSYSLASSDFNQCNFCSGGAHASVKRNATARNETGGRRGSVKKASLRKPNPVSNIHFSVGMAG